MRNKKEKSVNISREQLELLKKQKDKTGVPMIRMLSDAIDDYFKKLKI